MKTIPRSDVQAVISRGFAAAELLRNDQKAVDREQLALTFWELAETLDAISRDGFDPVADQLQQTNTYLSFICELMQEKKPAAKPEKFPQPLIDAAELLSRKLWLELPDEAKEDLKS